jgi:pSer/pThr/pTyr-binding forkhead associated (FHA) protein
MPLMPGTTILGRGRDADIRLHSLEVSRRHVKIECSQGRCTLADLQSANGTFVNGVRVTQVLLSPGDRLRLGDVELTYLSGERDLSCETASRPWIEVDGVPHEIPLEGAAIGRAAGSDIRLTDHQVSRRHARIETTAEGVRIVDLGSANGTLVNGKPVREHLLYEGDVIEVGNSRLIFHVRRTD